MADSLPKRFLQLITFPRVSAAVPASLSLFTLAKEGYEFGVSRPFEIVLGYYNTFISAIFFPLRPLVAQFVDALRGLLAVDIDLSAHWQHTFVLLSLVLIASLRTYVERRLYINGVVTLVFGFCIFLAASVGSGMVAVDHRLFLTASIAIAGFTAYEIVNAAWQAWYHLRNNDSRSTNFLYYVKTTAVPDGLLGAASIAFVAFVWTPGLAANVTALIIFILLLAFRNLAVGLYQTAKFSDLSIQRFQDAFIQYGSTKLGLSILFSMGTFAGFLVVNAGFNFLGL